MISKIRNWQVTNPNTIYGEGPLGFIFVWYSRGVITFDYGINTIRFGSGMNEIEGSFVLEKIISSSFLN